MKIIHFSISLLFVLFSNAQIGINTSNPKGVLDITTTNDLGLLIPRVSSLENVTDGQGNTPENGTVVYDTTRQTTCFYADNQWQCISIDTNGTPIFTNPFPTFYNNSSYVKASNTQTNDAFFRVAISGDGTTLAVGAVGEDSDATGINGDQSSNSAGDSGAVYVFTNTSGSWTQEAYVKASNAESSDFFGYSLALSEDGNTLAVGAYQEDSDATGINGNELNNINALSGAVYIFTRTTGVWSQQAYIKASNAQSGDNFGESVALSNNGNILAVGAPREDSNATGVNGDELNNTAFTAGATYIFSRSGSNWSQQAYIKASNTGSFDRFGETVSLSGDGLTLAVGSDEEDSSATGINGDQSNNSASNAGAVYVFKKSGGVWAQEAYIKASNTDSGDEFGDCLSLSNDGSTLAVGAHLEKSDTTGINGDESNNSFGFSGAVYVFTRSGTNWSQEAYIKSSNNDLADRFGTSVSLSDDGNTLAVGAINEDGNGIGIVGDESDNSASSSGAAYVFIRTSGVWSQQNYIKASNTESNDNFGNSVALSDTATVLVISASGEDSNATGVGGDQSNNAFLGSGAVYIYDK